MDFALNYSPQAAELLTGGHIMLDRFKCPEWPDLIATARACIPVYIHFDLRTDPERNGTADAAAVSDLRLETGTPFVNLHLEPVSERYPAMPVETTDPADIMSVTDILLAGALGAAARFGPEQVILENVPYHGPHGAVVRPAVEPEIIRRVVYESGCGFLLDISHARIAAHYMGLDPYDYLEQMPGDRLREIHVTGMGCDERGVWRDHLGLTEADWPFLEWALARVRSGVWAQPWVLAFEYGGIGPLFDWRSEPAVIAEQAPRLYDLAHAL